MNGHLVLKASRASLSNTLAFPQIVSNLLQAGVEYYHVDYVSLRTTYYGTEGDVVVCPITYEDLPSVALNFDAPALREAIRDSQQNSQPYREFSRRAMNAGVQSYFAFLRGQRVTYLGRQGDEHTEWFPGAAAKPAS
ncbi:MAG: hypothetical protein K0S45_2520 [Nitrospira sp.]|jgi:uncharacterized protein YbcV (DUF1398 family)|nr:hypothetical protein [Nitrospira sp.]